jgi:membrane associated rhomboid family serine protease
MSYRPYRQQGINPIWVIIIVNIIVYIATVINRNIIFERFGLIPAFLSQEPWTLFTYMFVHSGIFHILFNMIALYFFGMFTFQLVGEVAFLVTYFGGGIIGGLMYIILAPVFGAEYSIVVGASGAIYALGGLLVIMRPNTRVIAFPIPIPMPLWVAILIGFVLITFYPGVAWQAHLGGLLLGAAVGLFYRRRERRRY